MSLDASPFKLCELIAADVVIADLTETNPNVMYEVGVRQALLRPFVLLAQKGQKLPFDLADLRTVFYELGLEQVEIAKAELKSHLHKALQGTISPFDQALFSPGETGGENAAFSQQSRGLLAVLEVCESILKATQETKELVQTVGAIALEVKGDKDEQVRIRQEAASQQMGLMLMNQIFQNPESLGKLIYAAEKLTELGAGPRRIDEQAEKRVRRRK